ncbi:MAG: 30S ribosomal protein S20 [Gemmatimonadota bacterium]|nr:30S ribosomal protein S20 [Gemmatimonadota bacterium]
MPNIKSASKRLRQSRARRDRNRAVRSEIRTRVRALLATEDAEAAAAEFHAVTALLDKAAGKGVIPANTAARRKARLARHVGRLGA